MVLADPLNWWPTLENRKGVQANILSCSLDFRDDKKITTPFDAALFCSCIVEKTLP
jgi:hypothetical protein